MLVKFHTDKEKSIVFLIYIDPSLCTYQQFNWTKFRVQEIPYI